MPSSCSRISAAESRCSNIRSPALSCATSSRITSHSGVAYSGWEPTSRYSRAPFSRKTFEERPQWTTRRNRYRATSSGLSRRCPRNVQVTPYSFSRPKIRRSIDPRVCPRRTNAREPRSGQGGGDLVGGQPTELPPVRLRPVQDRALDLVGRDLPGFRRGAEDLHGRSDRRREVPSVRVAVAESLHQILGLAADRDAAVL